MKFELEFFEEFVTKECQKNSKLNSSISDYQKKIDFIEAESERIKKCFVRHLFEAKNDRKMELFIQQHQAHINLDYALEFVDNFFLYENQSVSF